MYIKPDKDAKDLDKIDSKFYDDALLYPIGDTPSPWDPEISVEGDTVVIEGGLSAGGSSKARCTVRVNVAEFSTFYKLEIPDNIIEDGDIKLLVSNGWDIVKS